MVSTLSMRQTNQRNFYLATTRALVNPTKAPLRSEVDLCVSTLSTYILLHKLGRADDLARTVLRALLQQVTASPASPWAARGTTLAASQPLRHSRFALESMLATVAVQAQFQTVLVNADLQVPVNHCSHLHRGKELWRFQQKACD